MPDLEKSSYSRDPMKILEEREAKTCKGCRYAKYGPNRVTVNAPVMWGTVCALAVYARRWMVKHGTRCEKFEEIPPKK